MPNDPYSACGSDWAIRVIRGTYIQKESLRPLKSDPSHDHHFDSNIAGFQ